MKTSKKIFLYFLPLWIFIGLSISILFVDLIFTILTNSFGCENQGGMFEFSFYCKLFGSIVEPIFNFVSMTSFILTIYILYVWSGLIKFAFDTGFISFIFILVTLPVIYYLALDLIVQWFSKKKTNNKKLTK